jgi:Xaa-Pro aminopeptidase
MMEPKMNTEDMNKKNLSMHGEVGFAHLPREEYEGRLKKTKELMTKHGIDALVLFSPENLYYYMGFKKENFAMNKGWRRGAIIPRDSDPVMLVNTEAYFNAVASTWVNDIRDWRGKNQSGQPQDFIETFTGIIKEHDLADKTLGMELWEKWPAIEVELTWKEFDEIKSCLPDARIIDAGNLIWEQRMVKTPWEIEIIKELATITTKGFITGLEAVAEGVSERDVINAVYDSMISHGVLWNQPIMGRIPVRGPGHYHAGIMGPQDTILKKGDMLMFDGGPIHKGYWSDIQRNVCIGEPPALQRKLYDASLAGLDAALDVIKPGVPVGEIHRAAEAELRRIDPDLDIIRNVFAGHGLGLHTHEPPYLDPSGPHAEIILEEGMYLAVEISAFDAPEFRVIGGFPEDDILVTEAGYENLTQGIPRELWIA